MPATSGCTSRSNTSRPNRRRTNEPKAFVAVAAPPRHEIFPRHPHLAQRAKNRRLDHRPNPSRGHQRKPLGHRLQSPAANDKRPAASLVRRNQLSANPNPPAKIDGERQIRDEAIGPMLDQKPISPLRMERSTQPRPGFEQRHAGCRVQFRHSMRRRQSGDSPANHSNAAGDWFSHYSIHAFDCTSAEGHPVLRETASELRRSGRSM